MDEARNKRSGATDASWYLSASCTKVPAVSLATASIGIAAEAVLAIRHIAIKVVTNTLIARLLSPAGDTLPIGPVPAFR